MIPVRHSAPSIDDGEQIACRGINPPAAWFATPGSRQVGYSEAMPECELKAESLMYVVWVTLKYCNQLILLIWRAKKRMSFLNAVKNYLA
jgi:hypothetical protein